MKPDFLCVAFRNYNLIEFCINYHVKKYGVKFLVCDSTPIEWRDDAFLKSIESPNVKVFDFKSTSDFDGENHGESLDFLISKAESDIVCTLDHDFFWLRPDLFEWVQSGFDAGFRAMGAQGFYPLREPHWQTTIDNNHPGRAGWLAPVCWGQFVNKELASKYSMVSTNGSAGYETGWKLREAIIENKIKNLVIPGFQYDEPADRWACYFGTPGRPVGLHLLKGITRDFVSERPVIEGMITTGIKAWGGDIDG